MTTIATIQPLLKATGFGHFAAVLFVLGLIGSVPTAGMHGNFAGRTDRPLRYRPDGTDFVIRNGRRQFNRPLYGPHTAFHIEAGDRPPFALYKDAKYGVLRLGVVTLSGGDLWLDEARTITARYRPGEMLYRIEDPVLGSATLSLTVLPTANAEGLILQAALTGLRQPVTLVWAYGGASGETLTRYGDLTDGDDLADLYGLRPADCRGTTPQINGPSFTLTGPSGTVTGTAPAGSTLAVGDAGRMSTPRTLLASQASETPIIVGQIVLSADRPILLGLGLANSPALDFRDPAAAYTAAQRYRLSIESQVVLDTPDPYINAAAGALCIAADALWQSPHYMHGDNAWRTPLLGWRGPYAADALGWHGRARTHFTYWANRQNTDAQDTPAVAHPDPKRNLGENDGQALHSYGAIPATHYDMSLVYIDELLRHFLWTGDKAYVRQTWPVIKRNLAWEKREFDRNGLYEAYAAIWASDAMQYNGGGTTHASAYNYLHFLMAARLARIVGEDPAPYLHEAHRIHAAMQAQLWLPRLGWYAEYKDILGLQLVHPAAAVYTVYHTLDSQAADPFESYEMLRYVDTQIPHIPVRGSGVPAGDWSVISTSDWLPYQWSLNNVCLAETAHTALAYWQSGQSEKAWRLWKGGLLDGMYLGACPGDVPNLSQFDANRGESYRDFGDTIGMTARSMIEGLYGILPDALAGVLTLRPGFPHAWDHAAIRTPDLAYSFRRTGMTDTYTVAAHFSVPMRLRLQVAARATQVASVIINGHSAPWHSWNTQVGAPGIEVLGPAGADTVVIQWRGPAPATATVAPIVAYGAPFTASFGTAHLLRLYDPQRTLGTVKHEKNGLTATATGVFGDRTAFAQVRQGEMKWWLPITFQERPAYRIVPSARQDATDVRFRVQNNTAVAYDRSIVLLIGGKILQTHLRAPAYGLSPEQSVSAGDLLPGTIPIRIQGRGMSVNGQITDWQIAVRSHWDTVDMASVFNDRVTQIFKNDYLSPRSPDCSLQIPIHALGSWSSPNVTADIDDTGLRRDAGANGLITLSLGIPFRTPGASDAKNIAFTSQWDNYPRTVTVPLSGRATHAYLLMAGSTDPMQSRMDNGMVTVTYADGKTQTLALNNPEDWWSIQQDYQTDDYAFRRPYPVPPRVLLKTGKTYFPDGRANAAGNGGAATVLDLPLDPARLLKSLTLRTLTNDVVIGLMGVTLVRGRQELQTAPGIENAGPPLPGRSA